MARPARRPLYCNFCGANDREVSAFITGTGTAICPDCARAGLAAIDAATAPPAATTLADATPRSLVALLDEWVIGQDTAKRALGIALYTHAKRVGLLGTARGTRSASIPKSNVLLAGPSGSGKTLLADVLARCLDLPFVVADVTTLTQAGYVGEDVESIFSRLLIAADGDLERAQRGIVFLDEVDKLARSGGGGPDVGGEGVQQGLLKVVEGASVTFERRGGGNPGNPADRTATRFDTRDVLFIAGGAFVGLDERSDGGGLGFGRDLPDRSAPRRDELAPQQLVEFGMLPEFVGRFPVALRLRPLDVDALVRILTEPQDALISQYQEVFRLDGHELRCTPDALRAVAERADALGTGARGLRAVLEATLRELMFDSPDQPAGSRIVVDAALVATAWDEPPSERTTTAPALPRTTSSTTGRPAITPARINRRSAR